MNGPLAQGIAVALHGSAWLARPRWRAPRFEQGNSAFQHVSSLQMGAAGSSIGSWLRDMARTGIPRIYLSMPDVTKPSPDRPWHLQAAAGVQFGLLTPLGGEAMIWVPQWAPAAGGGWAVTYQGRRTSVHPDVRDLRAPGEALVARLVRAAEFAERLSLPAWEETFTRVLTLAVAPRPVPPYYPDMLPSGCAEPVRVLVSMATAAYVFGGEGSWNDLGFEDPAVAREHQSISAELFAATMGAFTAAVNA